MRSYQLSYLENQATDNAADSTRTDGAITAIDAVDTGGSGR